ncbi:MAG TPA: D-sedoheptulose 7-phosphate isomerase [Actinomycetota bacterium]|nr:D-sedoheptulose 7-phosphate isomerase [Actinomycetota bacterium]
MTERIRTYLLETARTAERAVETCAEDVASAAELIAASLRDGGKVLFCGNGGSAGDAQHLATEFVSTLTLERRRPALAAIALTTDTSLLTAVANDFGFEEVFARQVEALGREGDVLVGISTSGRSRNVIRAFEQARTRNLRTLALTGAGGGTLAPLADVTVRVPSEETSHIQELHIAIGQLIAFLVEDVLHPTS